MLTALSAISAGAPARFGLGRTGRLTLADAAINPVTGNVENSTGWSLVAALRHFWTPQLRTEITASYSQLELGYLDVASITASASCRVRLIRRSS